MTESNALEISLRLGTTPTVTTKPEQYALQKSLRAIQDDVRHDVAVAFEDSCKARLLALSDEPDSDGDVPRIDLDADGFDKLAPFAISSVPYTVTP